VAGREPDVALERKPGWDRAGIDVTCERARVASRARRVSRVGPLALLLLALLVGCGSKITQENFEKIQVGMSEDEVTAILGKPTESSTVGFGSLSGGAWVWKRDGTTITIQFANRKVLAKQFSHKAP
jgi:hypothetical protein